MKGFVKSTIGKSILKTVNLVSFSFLFAGAAVYGEGSSASSLVEANHHGYYEFEISIKNVTSANLFSPFVSVVHRKDFNFFEVGKMASPGVSLIAETGNASILKEELEMSDDVLGVMQDSELIFSGKTRSLRFKVKKYEVARGATLNFAAMIGKSNDSFISSHGVLLKDLCSMDSDAMVRMNAINFDAGSEENSGNVEDFGPGGHPVNQAEGHVSYDRGLNLRGNAPEMIAWGNVAAVVEVRRLMN